MMVRRCFPLIVLASMASLHGIANAQERHADDISQRLFETYLARQGKIDTATVMAATHIVADRGRESGFWRVVLKELKSDNNQSEVNCVRVLGKMLAVDAAARANREPPERRARPVSVCLGPEVVAELLDRGQKASQLRDDYVIALARARVPEARDFFEAILREERRQGTPFPNVAGQPEIAVTRAPDLESVQFHAAVGLAQLGNPKGIDWLFANSENGQGFIIRAWPIDAPRGGSPGDCCVAALRQLSGKHELTSKAEWEAWSKTLDKKSLLDRAVVFGDP